MRNDIPLPSPITHTTPVVQRATGVVLGAAVADAGGAPFEFGPPGAWTKRFPQPVLGGTGELIGGGPFGWAPGEFTDDTQMAVALAESLLRCDGLDRDDLFEAFQAWARTAADVGSTTRTALGRPARAGAARYAHERSGGRSAANGALMRVFPVAVAFLDAGTDATMAAARAQAEVTHYDPAAGWGAAIGAALMRFAVLGHDPFAQIDAVLRRLPAEQAARFAPLLDPSWTPGGDDDPSNGSVWGCLAQAVWAVRGARSFDEAVIRAIDLGGDTDTVACVAGALAGGLFGVQAIPSRWRTYVHGTVGTVDGERRYDDVALQELARRLLRAAPAARSPAETRKPATEIAPGLHAADLLGASEVPVDWAVVSLCRTEGRFAKHPVRREVFLLDRLGDENPGLVHVVRDIVDTIDAFLAEGRTVVVHCHGGRSRTALALKAWAMRHHGLDERAAHDWMRERWPHYDPWNATFRHVLRDEWQSHGARQPGCAG